MIKKQTFSGRMISCICIYGETPTRNQDWLRYLGLSLSTSHTFFTKGSKNNTPGWMAKEKTETQKISDATRQATPIHHAHSCCPPNFFWLLFICDLLLCFISSRSEASSFLSATEWMHTSMTIFDLNFSLIRVDKLTWEINYQTNSFAFELGELWNWNIS